MIGELLKIMYKVIFGDSETEFADLDLAMAHAKTLNEFVTIKGGEFEIVGKFGVDSVRDGLCPDGVKYDWNKASRIGAPKRGTYKENYVRRIIEIRAAEGGDDSKLFVKDLAQAYIKFAHSKG